MSVCVYVYEEMGGLVRTLHDKALCKWKRRIRQSPTKSLENEKKLIQNIVDNASFILDNFEKKIRRFIFLILRRKFE